jgi:hypothetical protein
VEEIVDAWVEEVNEDALEMHRTAYEAAANGASCVSLVVAIAAALVTVQESAS